MTSKNNQSRTYAGLGYDVTYFARKHKISKKIAREILSKNGHDRQELNEAAMQLKQRLDKEDSKWKTL